MFQLEKYKGTKSRYTCPNCNARRRFVRYIDENGNYLSEEVGRCDRESKCGYHYKPKQFFINNPEYSKNYVYEHNYRKTHTNKNGSRLIHKSKSQEKKVDYIPSQYLLGTLAKYEQNAFVQFLLNLFPGDTHAVWEAIKNYFIGSYKKYTCFPYIDRQRRICKAKLIEFNQNTGKRLKGEFDVSSLVTQLQKQRKIQADFEYEQIFFGEHLLSQHPYSTVAIVEAEKTAIIASMCNGVFPSKFVWLATGSKRWLNVDRLKRIGYDKTIILYPDADGFDLWQEIAFDARREGLTVKVSNVIERLAITAEKANGADLADYLINRQVKINQFNEFADFYNIKVGKVLNDTKLYADFETILEEQKSILIINRELSGSEAENQIMNLENLRKIVLSLVT